jgi:hypothetical protein
LVIAPAVFVTVALIILSEFLSPKVEGVAVTIMPKPDGDDPVLVIATALVAVPTAA